MKQIFALIIALAILSFGSVATAEGASGTAGKKDVLSTDLFWAALGVGNLEYEHPIDKGSTFALRAKSGSQDSSDWEWTITGIGGSYRGYFAADAPDGIYYGLGMDFLQIDAEQTTLASKDKSSFIVPKLELGYQAVTGIGLTFAIGIEANYYSGSLKIGGEEFPLSGFGGGLRLSFGLAW